MIAPSAAAGEDAILGGESWFLPGVRLEAGGLRFLRFPARRSSGRRLLGFTCVGLALALPIVAFAAAGASWPSGGQNLSNSHSQAAETKLNANNVKGLAVKWTAQVHGDVSANPAVVNGAVYVPDWGGYLNKLDANTGAVIWSKTMTSLTGVTNDAARASPAVVGNALYIGDQGTQPAFTGGASVNGGYLVKVDATTGDAIWATKVDQHPNAILTAGPVVYNGVVYQGVASSEEGAAPDPSYPCCTFRGSIVAVDASTGAVLWQTYMVPDNGGQPCTSTNPAAGCGYSGGAIWGTTPAVDPATNTLYVTTGNNYTVPDGVKSCQDAGGTAGDCLSSDDHVDAVVALNATTGVIKWSTGVQGFDDWNVACIPGVGSPNNCPDNPGPDFDFGSGPNLFTIGSGKNAVSAVGAGQKSGEYWALDAKTGHILWGNAAGPGSSLGGIEWGPATDGKRVYAAEMNFFGIPYALPSGDTITSGSWVAFDPASGKTLWQVADPSHNLFGGGQDLGPVSVANGVLYAPSMSGTMRALDAANGKTLWSFQAAGSVNTGAAVVDGVVYWGSGYAHLGIPGWTGSTTFYAFSLNGN
jgi:polyvinyl alcohol dehydrogenase (cytochrome)